MSMPGYFCPRCGSRNLDIAGTCFCGERSPYVGRIEFAPYEEPRSPGCQPIDFRQFETPPIVQRLDRIIELLEQLTRRDSTP